MSRVAYLFYLLMSQGPMSVSYLESSSSALNRFLLKNWLEVIMLVILLGLGEVDILISMCGIKGRGYHYRSPITMELVIYSYLAEALNSSRALMS